MNKRNIFLVVLAIILFIFLAIAIKVDYLDGFESWFYNEAIEYMSEPLTFVLKIITHIGGPIGVTVICALIFLIPKTRNRIFIPVSLSVSTAFILNTILKALFARERPNILRLVSESYYSFPSGHAMVNMALYFILMIYTYKLVKSKKARTIIYVSLSILISSIGFTRIYLGVHYAGDIIGGWLLGFAVSIIIYMIMKRSTITLYQEKKEKVER